MTHQKAYEGQRRQHLVEPLVGRVAIVTGASRGIGATSAEALARAGARVALAARDEEALEAVAQDISWSGGEALVVPTDVGDPESVEAMVTRTVEHFGGLDIALNNAAGGGHRPTPLADVAVEDFDSGVAITMRGVFLSMKYELPAMLENGGGSIVNMASTAGLEAVGGLGTYVASKHGVIGLTASTALEYANRGIRVNAVAPGPILTENLIRAGEAAQDAAAEAMPMRRIGDPEEVAAAVVWLAGDGASFITGTTVPIDGGKMAGMAPFAKLDPVG